MHELGISRSIVAIAAQAAKGRTIRRVTVEVGKLSGVVPEALRFSFDVAAHGTALEGAALVIREIDGRARCRECGAEFAAPSLLTACACGSRRLQHVAGQELNVKTLELEDH